MAYHTNLLSANENITFEPIDGYSMIKLIQSQKILSNLYNRIKRKPKIVICYLIPLNGSIMKEKLSY